MNQHHLIAMLLCVLLTAFGRTQQAICVPSGNTSFDCALTALPNCPPTCRGFAFSFPSAWQSKDFPHNNIVSGEIYRPLRPLKTRQSPAVVVYHIIGPGTFVIERTQCRNLARHGVTALFFHLPFYGPRSNGQGPEAMLQSPRLFSDCLEQAIKDSRRAVDLLLAFPDVSPQKIGATGVSLGSLMTANAVASDPRFTKAMMILGGGNLRQIIAGQVYETQAIRDFLQGLTPANREEMLTRLDRYDPLACAPALRRLKAFAMVNADRDHIIPPDTSRQLAKATGTSIHWYPNLDHYTAMSQLADMLRRQTELFAKDVPQAWKPPKNKEPLPMALASRTARLFLNFTGAMPPQPGHAHVLQGILKVNLLGGLELPLTGRLALGPDYQFRAANAAFTAGQDTKALWFTDNQRVFSLPLTAVAGHHLFNNSLIDGYQFQLLQTALSFLAEAPDCLSQFVSCSARTSKDGFQTLEMMSLLPNFPATVYMTYDRKGTPKNLAIHANGCALSLEIHQLILNKPVPKTFFSQPASLPETQLKTNVPFHTVISKLLPFILPPQQH